MKVSTQYIDPLSGKLLFNNNGTLLGENPLAQNAQGNLIPTVGTVLGAVTTDPSQSSTTYTLAPDLRYTFSVAETSQQTITRLYQTSSWVGIISLGNSTNYSSQTTVLTAAQIQASSVYFYVDSTDPNSDTIPYIYKTSTETITSTGFQDSGNWSTSTWYGKKTYYQQTTEVYGI